MQIVGVTGLGGLRALKWAWQTFFWVDENNTFQLKFLF